MPEKIPFRVIHVSGQDDMFKAVELNTHSPTTRGWQSQRFCLYPQDLVIQLDDRIRLRKIQLLSHQYLIPTKIEFYVGDVPDGTGVNLQNARYTRLGYVSVSDNEKTGYKARELKSVHVDAVGLYLKLVIHKNHVNKHNLYNQVGVIAINVIGDFINKNSSDEVYLPTERDTGMDPVLAGIFNRPDYISPLDDLAFDMYQDPEVAQIIRRLEKKKQEAVLQERYDYAKKLKTAITELQKVGERLGKYEVEKRQAVENEDYDKAKLKKIQMDEFRLQIYKELDIHDLLEVAGSRHPKPIDLSPRQPTPVKLQELSNSPLPTNSYDERPLPAMKREPLPASPSPIPLTTRGPPPPPKTPLTDRGSSPIETVIEPEERALPVLDKDPQPLEDEDDGQGAITGEPEAMSEKDLREASSVIDIFGLPLVTKAYSKTWSFREDALLSVYKQMHELPDDATREDAKYMMRAAIHLVIRGVKDEVFSVFKAALNLLKYILTDFIIQHKIHKPETHSAVEKTLQPLLQKTGNTAVRHRDIAKGFTLEMAQFPEVRPINVVPHECVKPIKLSVAPRLGLSRTEIVHQLYRELTLSNSGLTVDNLMKFCTVALQHTAGEVREEAERIIVQLYKEVGAPVKEYLPPDDDRTRKNVLYRQLFEAFDKIDGKPSKADIKKTRQENEQKKQKEIEALQAQLQQLKDMTSGKAPVDEKVLKEKPKKKVRVRDRSGRREDKGTILDNSQDEKKKSTIRPPPSELNDDDTSTVMNADLDMTCIFCNEKNADFKSEENLDLHYWKHCPMLKRCANCKQVVEIAGLTDHLLDECDAKDNFAKCPRCTEAIPKPEHAEHVREQLCPAAKKGLNHCPLCHENIDAGEDGWKDHLMGAQGCKQNPRRVLALEKNKNTKPAGGARPQANKGRSNLPKPKTNARR